MARDIYGAPPSGDAFTDRRRSGIGGSDTGAILGISPYSSALACWEQKRGLVVDESPVSERMVWGSRLEGAILAGYSEDTGRHVRKGTFRRHERYPFVVGHPDAVADDRLIEVKTTAMLDSRWGEDGSADIPPHYYSQVQHYLILTDLPVADLAALVGGREMHVYTIPADAPFQEALLDEEAKFWDLVKDGVPPDPDGSASAGAALRRMFPRAIPEEVVATPEIALMAESYLTAKGMVDIAQAEQDRWAQLIQRYMGARERLVGPGFRASWSERAGSISWKGVAASYRDIIEQWDTDTDKVDLDAIEARHRGKPSRTFSLSKKVKGD